MQQLTFAQQSRLEKADGGAPQPSIHSAPNTVPIGYSYLQFMTQEVTSDLCIKASRFGPQVLITVIKVGF